MVLCPKGNNEAEIDGTKTEIYQKHEKLSPRGFALWAGFKGEDLFGLVDDQGLRSGTKIGYPTDQIHQALWIFGNRLRELGEGRILLQINYRLIRKAF